MGEFFGAMLMAVGGLIALLSGVCTILAIAGVVAQNSRNGLADMFFAASMQVLPVYGAPLILGIALIVGGWHVFRNYSE